MKITNLDISLFASNICTHISDLKNNITFLEARLAAKNKEINKLEAEVRMFRGKAYQGNKELKRIIKGIEYSLERQHTDYKILTKETKRDIDNIRLKYVVINDSSKAKEKWFDEN